MVLNDLAPADFAEKTVAYARAKTAYFTVLREEMPELISIATGREPRPPALDKFAAFFNRRRKTAKDGGRRDGVLLLSWLVGSAERFTVSEGVFVEVFA